MAPLSSIVDGKRLMGDYIKYKPKLLLSPNRDKDEMQFTAEKGVSRPANAEV
jgi:hypothetical protein